MQKFFKLSRVRLDFIFRDTYQYLKTIYNQTNNLFSAASPWGQIVSVINRLFGLNLYYIEDSITELNINTALRPNSIYGLAKLAGHNATRSISASGIVDFKMQKFDFSEDFNQYVILPNYLKLKCLHNSLNYIAVFSQEDLKINIRTEKRRSNQVRIFQGFIESQQFTGTGEGLQSFEVNSKEGDWIDNFFVNVYVNGVRYKIVESLYDISFQENACMVRTGLTSGIDIFFGNGSFGAVPELGAEIFVEYLVTQGSFGNIDRKTSKVFEFDDLGYDEFGNEINLNDFFSIKMMTPIIGGSNPENIILTKMLAPGTSRSLVLAQTSNYENFFERFQQYKYINIYTEYDIYDPYIDNVVYIFLIPDVRKRLISGKNYFNIPEEYFHISDYEKFHLLKLIEESGSKIFGTVPYIISPNFKKFAINVYLNVWEGTNNQQIKENVIKVVSDYLLDFKRKDYIPKSDLIAIIENVQGVDSLDLEFISEEMEKEFYFLLDRNLYMNSQIEFTDDEIVKLRYFYGDLELYAEFLDYSENEEGEISNTEINYIKENGVNLLENVPKLENSNLSTAFSFLMSFESVKKFVRERIDQLGNIMLEKNIYPLFRGGWNDRYGNHIEKELSFNKLSPINIFIVKKISVDVSKKANKININQIKNQ